MRNYFLIPMLLVLFTALLLSSCVSEEDEKERHYLKALEYMKQEDNRAAIIELRNAVQIDATFADARYQLGLLHLQENEPKRGFAELVRTADLDPDNLDASLKTAEFYMLSKKFEESRKLVDRILTKDAGYSDALLLLANLELIEGNFDAAHAALDRVDSNSADSARLFNTRGRVFAAQENWLEAEKAFAEGIAAKPKEFGNYQLLLRLYRTRKEDDKARVLLDELNTILPDNPQALLLLAEHQDQQADKAAVEETLKKIVAIVPEQQQYWTLLAQYYVRNNRLDAAESALIDASKAVESAPDLDIFLATLYFDQQKFNEARELLDTVLAGQSKNQGAQLLQARFMMKDGKLRESIEILSELSQNMPRWADPYFYLGLSHLMRGEIELGALNVGYAIQRNNRNYRYLISLAQIHMIQGDFENAKKAAATSLSLNRNNLPATLLLGEALIGSKEFQLALKLYEELNTLVPDNPRIIYLHSLALLGNGQKDQAIARLDYLLDLVPDDVKALTLYGRLTNDNDLEAAEALIRRQLDKAPESSQLFMLLGEIQIRRGSVEEAIGSFEQVLAKDPENIRAMISAGRAHAMLGDNEKAYELFEALQAKQPNSITARMAKAGLKIVEDDDEEAMQLYQDILELREDYAPAANNLAWLIAESDEPDLGEALRLAMLAKNAYPDDSSISDTLGWVHLKRESYSLAATQFELALNGRPGDPTLTYHYALALQGDGQLQQAKEILEPIVEKDVNFEEKGKMLTLYRELSEKSASE